MDNKYNIYLKIEQIVPLVLKRVLHKHLSHEDKEDLTQELRLACLEGFESYDRDKSSNMDMYIYHRALFRAFDWFKKQRELDVIERYDEEIHAEVSPIVLEREAAKQEMLEAIEKMDEGDRYMIKRYYGLDHYPPATIRELADEIGTSKSTVMRRLTQLLHHLKGIV